jgi:hypothetical protein
VEPKFTNEVEQLNFSNKSPLLVLSVRFPSPVNNETILGKVVASQILGVLFTILVTGLLQFTVLFTKDLSAEDVDILVSLTLDVEIVPPDVATYVVVLAVGFLSESHPCKNFVVEPPLTVIGINLTLLHKHDL